MGKTSPGGLNIRVHPAVDRHEARKAWMEENPGKRYPGPQPPDPSTMPTAEDQWREQSEEKPRGQSVYDQPDPRFPKMDREDLPFYRVWRPHGALSAADWAAVDAEEARDREAWEAAHPGEKYTPASYPRRHPRFEES